MDQPPLGGVARKLKRASAHMNVLAKSVNRYREAEHHKLISKRKQEGLRIRYSWGAIQRKPYPAWWPIRAGEVLYHVHSALDHIAWRLAVLEAAPNEPDNVTFPIFKQIGKFWRWNDRRGEWRQNSGAWLLERMPDPIRETILDLQPYMCGDDAPQHPLWRLYELSNEDKHKTLHIASSGVLDSRLEGLELEDLELEDFGSNRQPFDERSNEVGWLVLRIVGKRARIKAEPGFVFKEVFGDRAPQSVRGEPVAETLLEILNHVITIYNESFVPFFNDRATDAGLSQAAPAEIDTGASRSQSVT